MSMILAEKIAMLRKRSGWSQEELAMQLGISRQSVSKWESAASVPDLDKIIKLSEIFGVSTDFLLKEESGGREVTPEDRTCGGPDNNTAEPAFEDSVRKVEPAEAEEFIRVTHRVSGKIAAGAAMCVLSPVLLLLLSGLAEAEMLGLTEELAGGFGVIALLIMVAVAVSLLIVNGLALEKYQYFEQDQLMIDPAYAEEIERQKAAYAGTFRTSIAVGVVLCIISAVPLMAAAAFSAPDYVYVFCVVLLLMIVAFAVPLFIRSGMRMGCYKKILQEEEYTRAEKAQRRKTEPFAGIYWSIVTAVYLGISFWTMRWGQTWIIWPCAGVLFAAVSGIINWTSDPH